MEFTEHYELTDEGESITFTFSVDGKQRSVRIVAREYRDGPAVDGFRWIFTGTGFYFPEEYAESTPHKAFARDLATADLRRGFAHGAFSIEARVSTNALEILAVALSARGNRQ